LYIEGGAEGRASDSDFRRGWKIFLNELHQLARQMNFDSLEVVRGKGRANAYNMFKSSKTTHPYDLCVLLVDSEMEVAPGRHVWEVVAQRQGDHWKRPQWAHSDHLFLMVQMVETWLLTDHDALRSFFKERGFETRHLPTTDLENRSKDDINEALRKATKSTGKGPYRHGQAHEILEYVRPDRVKTLTHAKRLFDTMERMISAQP
jgi:hypothetical protein